MPSSRYSRRSRRSSSRARVPRRRSVRVSSYRRGGPRRPVYTAPHDPTNLGHGYVRVPRNDTTRDTFGRPTWTNAEQFVNRHIWGWKGSGDYYVKRPSFRRYLLRAGASYVGGNVGGYVGHAAGTAMGTAFSPVNPIAAAMGGAVGASAGTIAGAQLGLMAGDEVADWAGYGQYRIGCGMSNLC